MNFQNLTAFALDGIAHAAEALVGKAVGARDRTALETAVRLGLKWALWFAAGFSLAYVLAGPALQHLRVEAAGLRGEHQPVACAIQRIATLEEGDVPAGCDLIDEEASAALFDTPPLPPSDRDPEDLAALLYTSGSTGRPKGVMLSHHNAVSFVDWCSEVFAPRPEDRFSSHAPFHFDLSILDIHLALKHGATLVLVSAEVGKDPARLAPLIAAERISIWYSAPSRAGGSGPK